MSNLNIQVRIILFSSFLSMLSFTLLQVSKAESSEIIFSAAWGNKPEEIGLINQPEQERCGPLSFCADGRNVFILDTVHRQIVVVDLTGKSKVLVSNIGGSNICADGNGGIFVNNGEHISHINAWGKIMNKFRLIKNSNASSKLIEGYGMEMYLDSGGYLCLRTLKQEVQRLIDVSLIKELSMPVSAFAGNSSLHYWIKRMLRNEVRILGTDADGKVLVSCPLRLDGGQAGAVLFKGNDQRGNLYVEVEILKGKNVELEVHCYSPSGEQLRVFKLPNEYFTTVYKKTEISADGSVYQMLTTPDGVRIIRYGKEVSN